MRIKEKLNMNKEQLIENGPITIVALGDSVTHGVLMGEINFETVYWNRLKKRIAAINAPVPYVPINVINAGIEGTTAKIAVKRLDKQVLDHNPDLVIVCFGLNDCGGELEDYVESLRTIFRRCREHGADDIFLTPNMMCTYVAEDCAGFLRGVAAGCAEAQNNGRMDRYIEAARVMAKEEGIPVCDCYAKWREMSKTVDTTMMLSNRVNHPTAVMHQMFSDSLFDMIFPPEE